MGQNVPFDGMGWSRLDLRDFLKIFILRGECDFDALPNQKLATE